MGMLVEGRWDTSPNDARKTGGRFMRQDAQFRDWITADGSSGFAAAPGRYHLYVSYACPWAHRTLIFRRLKGLENMIDVSVVHPYMGEDGWSFEAGEGVVSDPVNGASFMRDVYLAAAPRYSGRCSVPVLWDKQRQTIVSNESSEIIRMFNSAFNAHVTAAEAALDFYPEELQREIDPINAEIYDNVNNGVYKCGFATAPEAYEGSFKTLFGTLDRMEERLGRQRYLAGGRLTEADWRFFATLVRFDAVYVGHFKCNQSRIEDYANLSNYLRELYQVPGVAPTVNLDHIKRHYYQSHTMINPFGIVPQGPALDFDRPHDRARLAAA